MVQYVYDAWGNHAVLDADGNTITNSTHIGNLNPFRYRSYFYDSETGLYFLKTRYYDPETGRFITIDGIEYLDPETINGLNLYAYCGNNPVMYTDPNGTLKWWQWLLGGLIAVASVALAIVTFGASTALIAAAAGALIGGAYGAFTAVSNGQDVFQGFCIGALSGITMASFAVIGSASIATGAVIDGAKIAFAGGALGGIMNECGIQLANYGRIVDLDAIFKSAIQGGVINVSSSLIGAAGMKFTGFEGFVFNYIGNLFTGVISFIIDFFRNNKLQFKKLTR